jgi:hypothetical protein
MNSVDEPNQPSNLKSHILGACAVATHAPDHLKAQRTMANPNAGLRDLASLMSGAGGECCRWPTHSESAARCPAMPPFYWGSRPSETDHHVKASVL